MGKVQIITKNQKIILDEIKNNSWVKENFYLSGGTALSAFYLQHRYSDDLDFFSEELKEFFRGKAKELGDKLVDKK